MCRNEDRGKQSAIARENIIHATATRIGVNKAATAADAHLVGVDRSAGAIQAEGALATRPTLARGPRAAG
eukprot:15457102-Alexandrium_andersonii.AAC.1